MIGYLLTRALNPRPRSQLSTIPERWGDAVSNSTFQSVRGIHTNHLMSNCLTFGGSDGPGAAAIRASPPTNRSNMGGKRFCGSQHQTRRLPCPYCGKRYADVLRHLNHRESKCTSWFTFPPPSTHSLSPPPPEFMDTDDAPPSPPPTNSEPLWHTTTILPNPELFRTEFPAAGKIYGRAKSFIDRFHEDKHATYRVQNPYYPFADQEEWELGSFLLGSGMSMQKVDEFLKLKLVCYSLCVPSPHLFPFRSRILGLHSTLPRDCKVELRCCQVYQTGNRRRSPSLGMQRRNQCFSSTAMPLTASNTCLGTRPLRVKSTSAPFDSIATPSGQSACTQNG